MFDITGLEPRLSQLRIQRSTSELSNIVQVVVYSFWDLVKSEPHIDLTAYLVTEVESL